MSSDEAQETQTLCDMDPDIFKVSKLYSNHYRVALANNLTIQVGCLKNFHLVSGDLRRECLPNGTWSGTEPVCEVDFLKDKWTLSTIIITLSFFLPVIWLGLDFTLWAKKRAYIRNIRIAPISDLKKMERLIGNQPHLRRKVHIPSTTSISSIISRRRSRRSTDNTVRSFLLLRSSRTSRASRWTDIEEHFKRKSAHAVALKKKRESDVNPLNTCSTYQIPVNQFATLGNAMWTHVKR